MPHSRDDAIVLLVFVAAVLVCCRQHPTPPSLVRWLARVAGGASVVAALTVDELLLVPNTAWLVVGCLAGELLRPPPREPPLCRAIARVWYR